MIKRLISGKGYKTLTPPQLSRKLADKGNNTLIVDLRETKESQKGHIQGAISRPFDDFLKDVVKDELYSDDLNREIILVCDTGSLSKVAGAIMAEDEGFTHVYSLSGGMRRWDRWMKLMHQDLFEDFTSKHLSCCYQNT